MIITPHLMPIIVLWFFDFNIQIHLWVKILRTIASLMSIPRVFTIQDHVIFTEIMASVAMIPIYTADISIWILTLPKAFETLDGVVFVSYFVLLGVAFFISCFLPIIMYLSPKLILSDSVGTTFGIFTLINLMMNAISLSTLNIDYYYTKTIFALTIISIGRYFDEKSFIYRVIRKHPHVTDQTNQELTDDKIEYT